jgi:serine/threonine-protein kinase
MTAATDRGGTTLLGYRLEELVGRGGMGVVYRARDERLKRNVALKLVAPELSDDEHFRSRFLAETELVLSLEHPNVVPIHDAGEADGQLYLAMRYVEGSDLRSLLRTEGSLEPARALGICGQVAAALDAAHARGLVHRDVKPSNVLLDERESVYLVDFGLSRRLGELGLPGEGRLSLGTPAYAAPEQIQGDEADGRADVYSLTCLLYECLTGHPPFVRDSDLAVLWAHLRENPPVPAAYPALAPVLEKGLAKDPDDRYATCAELVDAARDALGLEAVARPAARRRGPLAAAAAAVAVTAALAGVALSRENGAAKPSTRPTATPAADSVQRIDPKTNTLARTFTPGSDPTGVAVGEGAVWLVHHDDNRISKIDPRANDIVATGSSPGPQAVTAGAGAVWVVNADDLVTQIDPGSGATLHELTLPDAMRRVELAASGSGAVWVASEVNGFVTRINPNSSTAGALIDTHALKGALKGIAAGEGAVWVTASDILADDYAVLRIDPVEGRVVARVPLRAGAEGVSAGEGSIWVANSLGDTVSQIDSATNRVVRRIRVGDDPVAVAAGGGAVWVTNYKEGTVSRIDPKLGRVVARLPVGPNPDHVAVGEEGVWVTVHVR